MGNAQDRTEAYTWYGICTPSPPTVRAFADTALAAESVGRKSVLKPSVTFSSVAAVLAASASAGCQAAERAPALEPAAIETPVVSSILLHLDLPDKPPPLSPARRPPESDLLTGLLDQTPTFDPAEPASSAHPHITSRRPIPGFRTPDVKLPSGSRRLYVNLEAEILEPANGAPSQLLAIELIEVACAEVAEVFVAPDHVVRSGEHGRSNGNDGPL